VNEKLEDHPDVLMTKLVSGKVTFVHRQLWPQVMAIGTAREPWQLKGLTAGAHALLGAVQSNGTLQTDQIASAKSQPTLSKPGDAARELERKILIHAAQIHTASGAHAKLLETWEHWSERTGFDRAPLPAAEARETLEGRLRKLNDAFDGVAHLPWQM